jgi:hypothetical protein
LPPQNREADGRTLSKQLRHLYSPSLFSDRGEITIAMHYWSYATLLSTLLYICRK